MRHSAWLGAVLSVGILAGASSVTAQTHPSNDPVRIGVILSSGPVSQEIANGLAIALDENGPVVAGRSIQVIREDSSGRPEAALERARKLVAVDRADVLIGPVTTPDALALRDFVDEARVPLVVPEASANVLTGAKCSRYVLRVSYSSAQVAGAIAGHLATSHAKPRRIYMIAADDASGHDMLASFRQAYEAAGGEIVGETYVPRTAADFAPYLLKLRMTGADMAFAHFSGTAAERFVAAYQELRLQSSVKLAGTGWLVSPFHRSGLRMDAIAGAIGAIDYLPEAGDGASSGFARHFAARFGRLPSEHAAHGYDAGRLILAALRTVRGKTADRAALAQALARTPYEGARGLTRIDPVTNNVVSDIWVAKNTFAPAAARNAVGALTSAVVARMSGVAQSAEACKL